MTNIPPDGDPPPGLVPRRVSDAVETITFVISLASAVDRQRAFGEIARQQNVSRPWRFFRACEGLSPMLRYDARCAIAARGRPLHGRELACYSSHFETWRAFLASDARQLVVLEDDVVLDWAFLDRILQDDLTRKGIDYLKLFSKNMTSFRTVSNDFHGRWLLDCRGFAYGMQAYVLTRAGAQRVLAHCAGTVVRPVDDELDRTWVHGLPNLTAFPFPAFELSGPSSIGADRDRFEALSFGMACRRRGMQARERLLRLKQNATGFGFARRLPAYPSRRFGATHVQEDLL